MLRWVQESTGYTALSSSEAAQWSTLFLTVGAALLGATAIVASLVLFAMQVNVELMPSGLFKRLSSDGSLLQAITSNSYDSSSYEFCIVDECIPEDSESLAGGGYWRAWR